MFFAFQRHCLRLLVKNYANKLSLITPIAPHACLRLPLLLVSKLALGEAAYPLASHQETLAIKS